MLRAVEIGISVNDLELLTVGMVLDMFTEHINDMDKSEDDEISATQDDIDNF